MNSKKFHQKIGNIQWTLFKIPFDPQFQKVFFELILDFIGSIDYQYVKSKLSTTEDPVSEDFFFLIFFSCFRCWRIGKKHDCEADEVSKS